WPWYASTGCPACGTSGSRHSCGRRRRRSVAAAPVAPTAAPPPHAPAPARRLPVHARRPPPAPPRRARATTGRAPAANRSRKEVPQAAPKRRIVSASKAPSPLGLGAWGLRRAWRSQPPAPTALVPERQHEKRREQPIARENVLEPRRRHEQRRAGGDHDLIVQRRPPRHAGAVVHPDRLVDVFLEQHPLQDVGVPELQEVGVHR